MSVYLFDPHAILNCGSDFNETLVSYCTYPLDNFRNIKF